MRKTYRAWLEAQDYGSGTIASQLHRAGRVEDYYGDLDQHFYYDGLQSVLDALRYSTDDERRGRPNPSKIPFDGNPRTNLASYRNSIENYRRFMIEQASDSADAPEDRQQSPTTSERFAKAADAEEIPERLGLERDMQRTLRVAIDQLEPGLQVVDGGTERIVESGRIDITAQDDDGALVIIELKAGTASQRAVAQVLSYMGDVSLEEPERRIRGILVAADFDRKAIAAARMAPALTLSRYAVQFQFRSIGE